MLRTPTDSTTRTQSTCATHRRKHQDKGRPIVSKHIAETPAQNSADATSTPQSSRQPGSEAGARKILDELRAGPDVDEPIDWLPWDVT
jgi:hypothetical protein